MLTTCDTCCLLVFSALVLGTLCKENRPTNLSMVIMPAGALSTVPNSRPQSARSTTITCKTRCSCEKKFLERIQDLEKKVNDMYLGTDQLTTRMMNTIESVDKLLANGVPVTGSETAKQRQIVSFTVKASKNIPYLMESETIKFDEVLVNNGGAYDPHSGIFTAPIDGVYLFSTSILSGFDSTIETMITLNGHDVSRVYSGAFKNRGYGSSTVILNLRKEDNVAVAVFYGNGNYVHKKWSTFSGTLIETY